MTALTHNTDPGHIAARAIYLAISMQNYEENGPRTEEAARKYLQEAIELTAMLADRGIRAGLRECCTRYPVAGELYKRALLTDHLRRNRGFHFPELDALLDRLTSPPLSRN